MEIQPTDTNPIRYYCNGFRCNQPGYHPFSPELLPSKAGTQREATKGIFAMDTYITMAAYGWDAKTALSDAEDKMIELEQLWPVTDPDSDIYADNHSDGQPVNISEETATLLSFALQVQNRSSCEFVPS